MDVLIRAPHHQDGIISIVGVGNPTVTDEVRTYAANMFYRLGPSRIAMGASTTRLNRKGE